MSLDVYLAIGVDTGGDSPREMEVYSRNITHNVSRMWAKAGVFDALYDGGGKTAGEIAASLAAGVAHMESNRSDYIPLNPENGWGNYEGALDFLREYAGACRDNPKAVVSVSR
jgi:hypothetical protein